MKTVTFIIRTLVNMIFIAFCVVSVAFILTILMPENALKAVEVIRSLTP